MIKAIVFDFDDTLVETYDSTLKNLAMVTGKAGLPLPPESTIKEHYGKPWSDFVQGTWPDIDVNKFSESYLTANAFRKGCPPVKGVHALIDMLSRKFVLGICTGRTSEGLMVELRRSALDFGKFSFILPQGDAGKSKSDPDYFNPVFRELEKLGIGKEEILFVGDSLHDYEISRNTGIRFVGVLSGPATREDFLGAGLDSGMIIPDVVGLPPLLENSF